MTTNVIPTLIANSKSIGISEGTKKKLERFANLAGLFSIEMKAQDIYYESQDLKKARGTVGKYSNIPGRITERIK